MNARELKKLEQKCTEFTQKRDARLLKSLQEKLDKAHKIAESFPLSKIRKSTCSRKQNPEICQQLCKCNCVYGLALLIKSGYSISISEKIKYIITKGEPMEENKNEIVVSNSEVIVLSERQSRAVTLDSTIKTRVKIIGDNLYALCQELKEMRDGKLYQEIGYQNFEEYCENEVHISRQYAYDHIGVIENLPEDFVKTSLQNGGAKNKLMMIAKASEPVRTQIMQEDPELKESYRKMKARCKELEDKQKQAESRIKELQSENSGLKEHRDELQVQIQELENRPVEVMQSTAELEEIERLKAQNETLAEQKTELELKIWDYENQEQSVSDAEEKRFAEFTSNMNQQLVEERQRLKKESQEEIQRANLQRDNAFLEVEKLKKQLAEQKEDAPEMKQFKVRIATLCDSIEQLVKFLCENPDTAFLDKSETVVKSAESSLSEIRKQVQA